MRNDTQSTYDWLIRLLPVERPLRLLDLGCADCPEGEALVAAGVEPAGIELDEAAVLAARRRLPGVAFVCGDAADVLRGQEASFDVVLARRPDLAAQPGRWRQILFSAAACLAPHGRLLLTTPGLAEARLAHRWLTEAGFSRVVEAEQEVEGERFLVTASEPAARLAAPAAPLPAGVVRWEGDGDEEGEVCDVTTGICGPPKK